MTNGALATLWNCAPCAATRGTLVKRQEDLKLFPSNGPSELVAMGLLGPLPKTAHEIRHVLVMPIGLKTHA